MERAGKRPRTDPKDLRESADQHPSEATGMRFRYIIDTDWVIHYLNGHAQIVTRLQELADDGLGLSIVSLAELYEGVLYSRDPKGNERDLNDFLRGVTIIDIDEETCRIFGKERGRLRSKKKMVGDFDLLIGSTAIQHDATILTNNHRHFEMIQGVRLESLQVKR
jgi:tRNA(fMet)-specific endonuclease VapC